MFDKQKFSEILTQIVKQYNNISDFANVSTLGRSYISKYINLKLNSPPSPKVLDKIANYSKGITNYNELMEVCGHITEKIFANSSIIDHNITVLPLFIVDNGKLVQYSDLWVDKNMLEYGHEYFAFKSNDDSMLPLVRYWGYCYNRKIRYL